MAELSIACAKCKAEQPGLRPRSQVVTCWRCGAIARLSVERVGDGLQMQITPIDPKDEARVRFDLLGHGAAARPVKP